jgi:hypothetical protein
MKDPHSILTSDEKNICEYGAALGVVLTLICLVQHTLVVIPKTLTNSMVPAYFFIIIAFILLGLQKTFSIVLLIISAVFSATIEYLWITHYSFSLVVMLLFMYHVIAIVILFMQNIPKKLKMKSAAEKADRDRWAGKI